MQTRIINQLLNRILASAFTTKPSLPLTNSGSGMALGNDRFKSELTLLTGKRLHTLPPSRKLGWHKN
jgi:hypothetical protein